MAIAAALAVAILPHVMLWTHRAAQIVLHSPAVMPVPVTLAMSLLLDAPVRRAPPQIATMPMRCIACTTIATVLQHAALIYAAVALFMAALLWTARCAWAVCALMAPRRVRARRAAPW